MRNYKITLILLTMALALSTAAFAAPSTCGSASTKLTRTLVKLDQAKAAVKKAKRRGGATLRAAKLKKSKAQKAYNQARTLKISLCDSGSPTPVPTLDPGAIFRSHFQPTSSQALQTGVWGRAETTAGWAGALAVYGVNSAGWTYLDPTVAQGYASEDKLRIRFEMQGNSCALNVGLFHYWILAGYGDRCYEGSFTTFFNCTLRDGYYLDFTITASNVVNDLYGYSSSYPQFVPGQIGASGTLLVGQGFDGTLAISGYAAGLGHTWNDDVCG